MFCTAVKREVNRFVGKYLRTDGIFVLRMVTMHAGVIFGTDLIWSLWKSFFGCEYGKDADPCQSAPNLNLAHSLATAFDKAKVPLKIICSQTSRS